MRRTDGRLSYGAIKAVQNGESKTFLVHRLAYMLFIKDPGNEHVRHTCDNPICVNPGHLKSGTHQDNMQDMVDRDRHETKIPRSDLPRIVALLDLGVPATIIAQAWGVTDSTISLLKKRAYFKKYTAAASSPKETQCRSIPPQTSPTST